jgi:hypothetical protein
MKGDKRDNASLIGERRPRWDKWRQIEGVTVWEGVALSLDIDPDEVRHSEHSWMAGKLLFDEPKKFIDRLEIMCRKLSAQLREDPDDLSDRMVESSQFATWAISFGWSVPPELIEMAAKDSAQPTSEAAGEMNLPGAPTVSAPTYTTKLLRIVDAIRAEIGSDSQPNRWTRDAIEARAQELLPELSDRDAGAIATVLLPDGKRRKDQDTGAIATVLRPIIKRRKLG